MKINYKGADGRAIQLEVAEEVGSFYIDSLEDEKKNDRRGTRRHTSLSDFTYEDARYFSSGVDLCREVALRDAVNSALSKLPERQRYLFTKVWLEGWRYAELAASEGRDESTIRKAANKAREKFIKNFLPDYPL